VTFSVIVTAPDRRQAQTGTDLRHKDRHKRERERPRMPAHTSADMHTDFICTSSYHA